MKTDITKESKMQNGLKTDRYFNSGIKLMSASKVPVSEVRIINPIFL